ncbi:MAG: acyltransferase [Sphingomonas sp.]|jgi:exopolysaccharide production protein ExoZ|uniref:acyltransferase family protein n=1 Tax=Sphingomonas sp. TaxID=28214 RepID=UPI0035656C85
MTIREQTAPERPQLVGLQYLRAIAATGVVLFHATEAAGAPWGLGARGVDLFFVLSGFLMIAITDRGVRPWSFFKDRFLRVAPLYWIATATLVLVGLVGIAPGIPLDPARIATSFAFIPYGEVNARHIALPILPVGWTLNMEMLFYSVFALILFLPRYRMAVLTCVLGGLVLAGFAFRPTGLVSVWTNPLMLEFVAGGWLGMAWVRPERRRLILALMLPAMAIWLFVPTGRIGVLATLIVAVVLFLESRGSVPTWRALRLLGDASYSIYLWQLFPLLVIFRLGAHFPVPLAILAIVTIIAALGGGILAYLLIEQPLRRIFHRRRTQGGITIPAGP